MNAEMGEYLVGAYLEIIKRCDVVSYNIKYPGEGLKALGELDVLGLDFKTRTAYLCEVATHILGFLYGYSSDESVERVKKKLRRLKAYARKQLKYFKIINYQFWSPKVFKAEIRKLHSAKGLELVINEDYADKIRELRDAAKRITKKVNNPAFRLLQILEHMKEEKK